MLSNAVSFSYSFCCSFLPCLSHIVYPCSLALSLSLLLSFLSPQWRERAAVETDLAEQRKAHMIMLRSQLAASVMMTEGQVAAMEKGLDQGRPVESMLLRDRLYNMLKSVRVPEDIRVARFGLAVLI